MKAVKTLLSFILWACFALSQSNAQISITNLANPYNQNFDGLQAIVNTHAWTDFATIPGWQLNRPNYIATFGNTITGSHYSFGANGGAPDRCLGSIYTLSNGVMRYGVLFTNNSPFIITQVCVQLTAEQWRRGGSGLTHVVDFNYKTGPGLSIASSGFLNFDALDLKSVNKIGPAAALDGNSPANQALISACIPVNIPVGHQIFLRWNDRSTTEVDDGMGIDNMTVTFSGAVCPLMTFYPDNDGDGFGNPTGATTSACFPPAGYVIDNTDCNDNQANAFPGNLEICDGIDNDCDTATDEGFDADGDGTADCFDGCPADPTKIAPGICGCGVSETAPPTAQCQNVVVQLNAAGTGSTSALAVNNGSSDACGIAALSLSKTNFDCSNLGANAVTLVVTDVSGNSATCGATVTVQDNIFPTIFCPANIVKNNDSGQCSAVTNYSVSASDNCTLPANAISRLNGLASGSAFPVGVTNNIFKATDAFGNIAYCTFAVTVNVSADPNLAAAYTVIGFDEVKMKTNTVQSGGVGVVNAGKKAKLEQTTRVTAANTFVKAPVLDLNSGSTVTTYHPGQVSAGILPAFQWNNCSTGNDVNIPDYASQTLPLANYGTITVGKYATVTFSGNAQVWVKDIKMKEGASLVFAQSTTLLVDKKLDTDKSAKINQAGTKRVQFFVEEDVKIDGNSIVKANIYSKKNLKVEKSYTGNTLMTGLFIAEKVDAKENVLWNRAENACPGGGGNLVAPNNQALTFDAYRDGGATNLKWFNSTATTDDYFVVERAGADAQTFHPMLKIEAEGPAGEMLFFNESDKKPLPGDNFYRLRLVSKDGSESYSDVKKVVFPAGFAVYPNPNSGATLNVSLGDFAGQNADIEIHDPLGNLLETKHFEALSAGELALDVSKLASGTYYLLVKTTGQRAEPIRFVVQRQ